MRLGKGIVEDVKARLPWYTSDWKEGFQSGIRILAPSVYIFFASLIPGLAFGEQIDHDTFGAFNGSHVLVATAVGAVVQSFVGGQPLLILGVAEPAVLMYGFMYKFADGAEFTDVFVPWCAWVCIWGALFLIIFAVTGLCEYITKFTRFSGELFGMLIAILFMQQAIKGVVQEFKVMKCSGDNPVDPPENEGDACDEYAAPEKLVNGLWATILAIGTVSTSMLIVTARSWRFFKGEIRSFLADYGVPLMVVVWSGVSYAIQDATPEGLPRRLSLPNTWDEEAKSNWGVAGKLLDVSGPQIAYAMVPALILALLFYFDHSVSAQLAQQKDFQLVRPTAYNWDLFVVAILMVIAGLLGIPPPNCVIPQAPMHTKSLVTLKQMLVERNVVRKERLNQSDLDPQTKSQLNLSSLDAVPANTRKSHADLQAAASAAGLNPSKSYGNLQNHGDVALSDSNGSQDVLAKHGIEREYIHLEDGVVALNVKEQRLSNLIQGILVAACLAASPAVKRIPKSVLWGYFAYMSLESLPGSEFWDRILLAFTDKRRRLEMLQKEHPVYLETVTFRNIMLFTALQAFYLCIVWGVTWAGAVGIAFPFLIVLLIPGRQYIMPRMFDGWTLSQLDAAEYEQASSAPAWVVEEAQRQAGERMEKTEFEKREALEAEMPGFAGIKHHLTQDELSRRRLSLHQNSLRGSQELHNLTSGEGASRSPKGSPVGGAGAVFSAVGNSSADDRMERGTNGPSDNAS